MTSPLRRAILARAREAKRNGRWSRERRKGFWTDYPLAPRGITVNSVSPGLTDDSVLNGLPDPVVQTARTWHASGFTPMGRMGTPADIGNVVALLASPYAAWISGQLIDADGGASLVDTLMPLEIQRG